MAITPVKQSYRFMVRALRKFSGSKKNIKKQIQKYDRLYQLKNYDLWAPKPGKGLELAKKQSSGYYGRKLKLDDLIDKENRLTHPLWGKVKKIRKKRPKALSDMEKMENAERKLREVLTQSYFNRPVPRSYKSRTGRSWRSS